MSIITDALKKAQQKRSGKQDGGGGPVRYSPYKPLSEKILAGGRKSSAVVLFSVAVFGVAIFGGTTGVLMLLSRSPITRQPALPELSEPQNRPPGTPAVAEPAAKVLDKTHAFKKTRSFFPGLKKNPLALNGIMFSPAHPRAVINGEMATEGDIIKGFSVNKILPDKVLLTSNGKDFELKLR